MNSPSPLQGGAKRRRRGRTQSRGRAQLRSRTRQMRWPLFGVVLSAAVVGVVVWLLAGMLLPSGNDAAVALADHVAGSDRKFARLMNARAKQMGLGCTHYVSSYGLQPANRSCAADLAALARVAIAKPRIARLTKLAQAHVRFPIKTGKLWLSSTNPLLRMKVPGTIGLKTGPTSQAGQCFVAIVRRSGREYGVVLLSSPNIGDQAAKLVNAAVRQHA